MTKRALLIGLAFVVLLCAVIPYNDYYLRNTYITGNHFPLGAVVVLTVLVLVVNIVLRYVRPRSQLRPGELMVIWIMIIVSSGIPSSGLMRYLVPYQVAFYYLNPEQIAQEVHPHIPAWLAVSQDGQDDAVIWFYDGLPEGERVPWRRWVRPMLLWSIFFVLLYGLMISISSLLRKQWIENERLSFPLAQIPLAMAEAPERGRLLNSFFGSPALWTGAAAAFVYQGVNGIHAYFPEFPAFPQDFGLNEVVRSAGGPWRWAILWTRVYPSVIGVSFLLTAEVSFSLWFFYLAVQAQRVLWATFGDPLSSGKLGLEQGGAYFVYAIVLLWVARTHIRRMFGLIAKPGKTVEERHECAANLASLALLAISLVGLVAWCCMAGMTPGYALASILIFAVIFSILTRVVVETGLLFVQATFLRSFGLLSAMVGTKGMSGGDIAMMGLQGGLFHDARELVMPSVMNSYRIADAQREKTRWIVLAIGLAILVAMLVSAYASIDLAYTHGANNLQSYGNRKTPSWVSRSVAESLKHRTDLSVDGSLHIGAGAAVTTAIFLLRSRFYWFKLHPVGLIMAHTYPMWCMWFSIFLAWMLKVLAVRFWGGSGYARARRFFLGLIVGDSLCGAIWIILGFIAQPHSPIRILPG